MMKRFLLWAGLLAAPLAAAPPPTNVVFLLADDLGFMDITPNNPRSFYETPNLKRLADSGIRFTRGYAACPVCSPTRSSILTGRYPARTHNTDYFGAPNGFDPIPAGYEASRDGRFGNGKRRPVLPAPYLERLDGAHTTLAEAFKAGGYATFFAGKWHLGPEGCWPEDHGFDVNMGGTSAGGPYRGGKYFSPYENPRLPDGPPGEHLPDRLARETASFIRAHKDRPFLAYLAFYSVHTPLMGRPDLVAKYEARKAERPAAGPAFGEEPPRKVRLVQDHAVYAAMVEAMDQAVGKVLDAIDDSGLASRTLVVFFSDNGGLSTSEGSPTSNLPLRAGKGWLYEGGIREPLLVRWPGVTAPGSVCDQPVISTDFFPTLLEACGLPLRSGQHVDGRSFVPLLRDPRAKVPDRRLFWHYPHWGNQGGTPGSAVLDGKWKYIAWSWGKAPELFDLSADPGESTNLADRQPEVAKRLGDELEAFLRETKAHRVAPNPTPPKEFKTW